MYPEIREAGIAINGRDPYPAYLGHIANARSRGIGFKFTFAEWWSLWEPYWGRRGKGSLQMCMCRRADKGDYEMGNVRIATNKENCHERALEWKVSKMQRPYRPREYRTPLNAELASWAGGSNRSKKPYTEEEENA